MNIETIYGPPGTGKTTRILDILDTELLTVPVERIALFSFTNAGVDQATKRAKLRYPLLQAKQFQYFRTLHSLAFREMECRTTCVMGKKHYREFSNEVGFSFSGYYSEELVGSDDKYLFFDGLYRNNPTIAALYLPDLNMPKLKYIRASYKKYKEVRKLYDYTDILESYVANGKPLPIDVAFIDEAQDLTTLQWRMVWKAVAKAKRVYIAGDDDQAIYQWSGADVNAFMGIESKVTILDHSYRVPSSILSFATSISNQISKRVNKVYSDSGKAGSLTYVTKLEHVTIGDTGTYMFLSRNNCFLEPIVKWLREAGYVYRLKGTPSVNRQYVEAIKQYEEWRKKPFMISPYSRLGMALKDTYNMDDPWYESFRWEQDEIDYYRNVIGAKSHINDIRIDVSTIHSVKGAEADHVVLLSDMTRSTYKNLIDNPDSEHRAFYVGVTRAKESLTIVEPQTRLHYKFLGGGKDETYAVRSL